MKWLTSEMIYIALALGIFGAAYILSRVLKYILGKYIDTSATKLATEVTNYNFLKNAINFFVINLAIIVLFYSIPSLRDIGLTLLASAGIFAATIGLASQQAFSNIVSGIFIVIFKPFRVGDVTEIQGNLGKIEDITLRHTVIRNFQNRRVIIPNSVISNETIINSSITEAKICNFFEIGISYDSDVDVAMKIINEEATNHPNTIDNRSEEDKIEGKPIVVVRLVSFGDSSVNIRAYIWTEDNATGWILNCDINKSIKERFAKEGIEIPYPHRTIVYKNNTEEK